MGAVTLDVGTLIAVVGGAFALAIGAIGFLVRQLFKSHQERLDQQLGAIRKDVDGLDHDRQQCEARSEKAVQRYVAQVEKLRDDWLRFVQDNAAIEMERSRKVDGLFRVSDAMRAEVAALKPEMFQRLKELHARSEESLKAQLQGLLGPGEGRR